MSTTPKKQSIDRPRVQSDVLSSLKCIKTMFEACQSVLNTYTQATLMLSIITEAKMLQLKLQVMKERWGYHLPFKEACTVDFYEWSREVKRMSLWMTGNDQTGKPQKTPPEYCPSKHFMLDFYTLLPENNTPGGNPPYYTQTDTAQLIAEQEKIRREINKKWPEYKSRFSRLVVDSLSERFIADILQPLEERSFVIAMTCADVLMSLSKTLLDLHEMPREVIKRDQFIRLAERVVNEPEYGGPDAQKAARRYVVKLKNETPEDDWPRRREDDIAASGDLISEMKYGGMVFRYLSHNYNIKGNYAGFGRFLNTFRRDISEADLADLLEELFRILYLREDLEQQERAARKREQAEQQAAALAAQPESKSAEAVYRRWAAAKPQRPDLPNFFTPRLAKNPEAVEEYYDTLHHCGFYIGRTLIDEEKRDRNKRCYDGWKWKYLREAFIRLGFFKADSSKKGFAEHLAEVFPYLVATNIQRGFNDRGSYTDTNTKDSIITAMVYEFEDVKALMERS